MGVAYKSNDVYGFSAGFFPSSGLNSIYAGGNPTTTYGDTYSVNIFNRKYKKIVPSLYSYCEFGAGFSWSNKNISAYSGYLYFTPGVAYRIYNFIDLELLMPNIIRLYYNFSTNFYNSTTVVTSTNTVQNGNGTYTTTTTYRNEPSTYTTKNAAFGLNTSLALSSLAVGIRIVL